MLLAQVLLEGEKSSGPRQDRSYDPFEVLYHISPASALSCLPVFLMLELKPLMASSLLQTPSLFVQVVVFMLMGGGIAFLLILVEIKLVKMASSLTVGFFGSLKEIVQILLAMLVFHDSLSALNIVGLFLAMAGTLLYKNYKMNQEASRKNRIVDAEGQYSSVQLSGAWADIDTEESDNAML